MPLTTLAGVLKQAKAETLVQAQRYRDAAAVLQQALAITAKEYPKTHPLYLERAGQLEEAGRLAASGATKP